MRGVFGVDPNQSPVDMYIAFHVGLGAISRKAGLGLGSTVLLSLAWEWVAEPLWKERYPEIFPVPSQDSAANRIMDTVGVAAGWYLGAVR